MNKIKYLYVLLAILGCFSCNSNAQNIVSGKITPSSDIESFRITCQGIDTVIVLDSRAQKEISFQMPLDVDKFSLNGFILKNNKKQVDVSLPICLNRGKSTTLDFVVENDTVVLKSNNKANAAIQEFRVFQAKSIASLWDYPPKYSQLVKWFDDYTAQGLKIMDVKGLTESEKEFLDTYRQVNLLDVYKGLKFLFPDNDAYHFPKAILEKLPDYATVIDKPYWHFFPNSGMNIFFYLQDRESEPEGQLRLLNEKFTTQSLKDGMYIKIVNDYVKRFPYSSENMTRLENLCSGYAHKAEALAAFKTKEFTTEGAPCPDVYFEDINGNKHKLSEFKGKYIYVDMWASWCAPCCAEVPHLEKLKKEVKNDKIVFVGISLDNNKTRWKDKMEKLGMDGNQWILIDKEFTDKLGIKTIPHFLIYDKEGKLYKYRAPRPSSISLSLLEGLR